LTLAAATDTTPIAATIRVPQWPPVRHEAVAREAPTPVSSRPRVDRVGSALPDRVVALGADLGLIADARRALSFLYCWPSWFLLTIEATATDSPLPSAPRANLERAWEMEDDWGNVYAGMETGAWSGQDNGAHVAFAPGLDRRARELRLSFPDPFGRGQLNAVVAVPR
jgi:hypothetical protein